MFTIACRPDGKRSSPRIRGLVQVILALWTVGIARSRAKMPAAAPAPSLSP
jgi:hypothetical protein